MTAKHFWIGLSCSAALLLGCATDDSGYQPTCEEGCDEVGIGATGRYITELSQYEGDCNEDTFTLSNLFPRPGDFTIDEKGTSVTYVGSLGMDETVQCTPGAGTLQCDFGDTSTSDTNFSSSLDLEWVTPHQVIGTLTMFGSKFNGDTCAETKQLIGSFAEQAPVCESEQGIEGLAPNPGDYTMLFGEEDTDCDLAAMFTLLSLQNNAFLSRQWTVSPDNALTWDDDSSAPQCVPCDNSLQCTNTPAAFSGSLYESTIDVSSSDDGGIQGTFRAEGRTHDGGTCTYSRAFRGTLDS
jgi:hypothetical protein